MQTYAQYLLESKKRQRRYIKGERSRMDEAYRLCRLYEAAMARLDLHPLSATEITDRQRELTGMWDRVEETHGDSEAQRAHYDTFVARSAA